VFEKISEASTSRHVSRIEAKIHNFSKISISRYEGSETTQNGKGEISHHRFDTKVVKREPTF
jgi:hypothetical protein